MSEKEFKEREIRAFRYIRNQLIHGLESPSVRDVMKELGYDSPRSAMLIINHLIAKGVLRRRANNELQIINDITAGEEYIQTCDVPLVGIISCGAPIIAEENIEGYIPVDMRLASPGHKYFLLRARGDSMNDVSINDGNLVLVRQQPIADVGQKIVALIDDEATIKEFQRKGDTIVLMPRSKNKDHKPIILTDNFQIQGVVIAVIPDID